MTPQTLRLRMKPWHEMHLRYFISCADNFFSIIYQRRRLQETPAALHQKNELLEPVFHQNSVVFILKLNVYWFKQLIY